MKAGASKTAPDQTTENIPAPSLPRWANRYLPRARSASARETRDAGARGPPVRYLDKQHHAAEGSFLDADRGSRLNAV